MSITILDAYTASEFHISHAGHPCEVWQRAGVTHYGPGPEQYRVGITRQNENDGRRQYHGITTVNAGDFHVPAECPRLRTGDDRPPASHMLTADASLPTDRNIWGYDADGYDADGYDADGYDADGYDADGYDAEGNNEDGFARDTDSGDLDLAKLWSEFQPTRWNQHHKQGEFREYLRKNITNPDAIDELSFCQNCGKPGWYDDMSSYGDSAYCDDCWSDLPECASCDEKVPDGNLTETLNGSDICDSCLRDYYSYCDYCEGYYNDASDGHEHGSGCCDSPEPDFTVRNDGCEPLANSTRITFELPAGTISAEGLDAIRRYLREQGLSSESGQADYYNLSYEIEALGDKWQTREGNYAKRLSRLAYQKLRVKLSQDIMSQVGCIAREHSNAVSVTIEVSRELNESAGYWYHKDSCWWGGYNESRCAFKTNGGFGLRSFADGAVSGRAWVLPLRKDEQGKLVPTFETMTPDAFIVFNGYGDLNGYAAPRIVAHMAGWTYRKIGYADDTMYVNAGGYLVAPEDIAAPYTDRSLCTSLEQHSHLYETERERELVSA